MGIKYGRWLRYCWGLGEFGNLAEVVEMEEMPYEEQKAHVKKLWQEDSVKYTEWKEYCINLDLLPEFFGTHDNPKEIDESKLYMVLDFYTIIPSY